MDEIPPFDEIEILRLAVVDAAKKLRAVWAASPPITNRAAHQVAEVELSMAVDRLAQAEWEQS